MKYLRYLTAALVLLSVLTLTVVRPMAVYAASEDSSMSEESTYTSETGAEDSAEDSAEEPEKVYIPRLEAPSYYNEYYFSRANTYYASGYGMPNCTAYAFGRVYEILEAEPRLSLRDAGCWWKDNIEAHAYDYGQEPRLGAVACWDNYDESTGHVSIVEEIREDGSVLLSESSWSGYFFDTFEIDTAGKCKYTSSMRFLGYIYPDRPLAGGGTQIIAIPGFAFIRSQLSKDIFAEESAEESSMPEVS